MDVCRGAYAPCLSGVLGKIISEGILPFMLSSISDFLGNLFSEKAAADFLKISADLWKGFEMTLLLFALTLVFALPLGLIISFGSMSRFYPLRYFTKLIVWIVRGTPLMLQIFVVFFTPGLVFKNPIFAGDIPLLFFEVDGRFLAALITFVINYACYFSEIYRGGIESISKGQYEAGQVLGMSRSQTFFHVVLLQVVKRILPPISNEVITLVKDTSLVRVISVIEIIRIAERYSSKGLIWPLFFTSVYYLVFNGLLTLLFGYIEKKLDYFKS